MRINVKVIPRAKREKIQEEGKVLKIYVRAPAIDGKANIAMIELLVGHFNVKKSDAKIIKGERSRDKIVEINSEK